MLKTILWRSLVIPILLSLSLFGANSVKIMPLGDSITKGYVTGTVPEDESGYRGPLWSKLIDDGYDFDFVGSYTSGENYDPSFDSDHAGYNGRITAELDSHIDDYLDNYDPQVILLHIGTNDLKASGYDVTTSTSNVKSILDKIYAHNRNIKVLLARIIDFKSNNPDVTTFNDSVVAMANSHAADIDIVNMEDGAGIDYTTEMQDEWHPKNTGYIKMAGLWYSSLKTAIPMHLWKMEEATGSSTYLDSYREANGTCTGDGCPTRVTGKTDYAQEFDGNQTKINVTNATTFDWAADGNFTIEFWMKTNASFGNQYEVMIGRKGPGGGAEGPDDRWYVGVNRDSSRITYGLANREGGQDQGTGTSIVGNGEWHHIAYVITSERIMLYVDGRIDVNTTRVNSAGEHVQGTPVNIGYLDQDNGYEYTGQLDEITVYDGALSTAQVLKRLGALQIITDPVTVTEVYEGYSYDVNSNKDPIDGFILNSPTPDWLNIDDPILGVITGTPNTVGNFDVEVEAVNGIETALQNYVLKVRNTSNLPSGMVSYWKLDETVPSFYLDTHSGADGTCEDTKCPAPFTDGKVDGAQEFDGTDNKMLNITNTATFDWGADDSFTIEFWMNAIKSDAGTYEVMIGRKGGGADDLNDRWYVGVKADTGNITYGLGNSSGSEVHGLGSSISDGYWHHIAYVVTSERIMLYVDGGIDVNRTRDDSAGEHVQDTPVNIGYLNQSGGFEYTGLLDNIAVFDRALNITEIEAHHVQGLAGIGFDTDDVTKPEITMIGSDASIEVGTAYTDEGATAFDNIDGDITADIATVSDVNTNAIGSYTVTYNVTDAAGNPADEVSRTVDVNDTTSPVITLIGENPQVIEVGSPYVELNATAEDNADGNISANIVIDSSNVNTNAVGSYTVTYDVSDAAENPADPVTRTVDVVDTTTTTFLPAIIMYLLN